MIKDKDGMSKEQQKENIWSEGKESDIVIHPVLCHKLGVKDAEKKKKNFKQSLSPG